MRPGGTTTVSLRPDDRLTIRDLHGGQRAEVTGLAGPDALVELFGPTSPPGAEETFRADREAVVRVAAPAGAPVVEGGVPASDLQLEIARATPARTDGEAVLPDPLADPRLDFQVDRASALAYEVKAGRVHPGDRRTRAPVLRLPRLQRAEAPGRARSAASTRRRRAR